MNAQTVATRNADRRIAAAHALLWVLGYSLIFAGTWAFLGATPADVALGVQTVIVNTLTAILDAAAWIDATVRSASIVR